MSKLLLCGFGIVLWAIVGISLAAVMLAAFGAGHGRLASVRKPMVTTAQYSPASSTFPLVNELSAHESVLPAAALLVPEVAPVAPAPVASTVAPPPLPACTPAPTWPVAVPAIPAAAAPPPLSAGAAAQSKLDIYLSPKEIETGKPFLANVLLAGEQQFGGKKFLKLRQAGANAYWLLDASNTVLVHFKD